MSELTYKKLYI